MVLFNRLPVTGEYPPLLTYPTLPNSFVVLVTQKTKPKLFVGDQKIPKTIEHIYISGAFDHNSLT
jgi:hypothetical protein